MPKAAKSPSKSPAKPRASRSPKKKPVSKPFIDDEAGDSDVELKLRYPDSDPEFPASLMAPDPVGESQPVEEDQYEKDFINDGDPFENASESSAHLTPPPRRPKARAVRDALTDSDAEQPVSSGRTGVRARRAPVGSDDELPRAVAKRVSKKKSAETVIELTSSEEDLEALAEDDSMFRKPSGIKATALPGPLKTRSSAKRTLHSDEVETSAPRRSPPKKVKPSTDAMAVAAGPDSDMARFMGEFMNAYMAQNFPGLQLPSPVSSSGAPPAPAKSKTVPTASSSRSKGSGPVHPSSPDWDPPYGAGGFPGSPKTPSPAGKIVSVKGKGKASSSASKRPSRRAPADVEDDGVDAEVSKFMQSPTKSGKKPLTMAEYFGADKSSSAPASSPRPVDHEVSTVFLEEIETYRAYFNPSAPCGVFDLDLQDPSLLSTYPPLVPLPGGRQLLPAYDPNRNAGIEPVKGGRVKYKIWGSYIPDMFVDNSLGAILFEQAAPNFINPSRVSPVRLSSKVSAGSTTTYRLHVDDRVAVCVSALFCAESKLVVPAKIGGRSERLRKWLAGIFHNQEWERFESLINLVFGEHVMRAQISSKNAVSFQTMISPDSMSSAKDANDKFDTSAPADMFAPVVNTNASKVPSSPSKFSSARGKTLLAHDERVPVYDARKVVVDFNADLTRLDEVLPPYVGEIPFGSFVVVGYTCSMYRATISGSSERVPHLGCNILWAIVCGVPKSQR